MRRAIAILALVAAGTLAAAPHVHGQTPPSTTRMAGASGAPLLTTDPRLLASLQRITRRSALWRSAVEHVRLRGRRVVVVTAEDVVVKDSRDERYAAAFDPGVLGEVSLVPGEGPSISTVLVVVNLELLDRLHKGRGLPLGEREADLDRILVHEVYGHALPYLLVGDASGRCADPAPGEPAEQACSIRRENAVRAEMGLGYRSDSGLQSLALH
jgi:hypothetical protein